MDLALIWSRLRAENLSKKAKRNIFSECWKYSVTLRCQCLHSASDGELDLCFQINDCLNDAE